MEEDVLCAVRRPEPRPACRSAVLHGCDDSGSWSPRRRSGRLSRATDRPEERIEPGDDVGAQKPQLTNTERGSWKNHEGSGEIPDQRPGDKTGRGCKRKLELPPAVPQSLISEDLSTDQQHTSLDLEMKCPPPAKRWVIGPLLQSFKSKMASFTEIVMSPVRLFKSNDSSLSSALPDHHEKLSSSNSESSSTTKEEQTEGGSADNDGAISKRETVVQRLRFNTSPSDASDSDENKVVLSPNRSEGQGESVSGSVREGCGSSSTRDLSGHTEEPTGPSDVCQGTSEGNQAHNNEDIATSASEQNESSESSQERSGFTKPRLKIALTDISRTTGRKPTSPEAPCPNASTCTPPLAEEHNGELVARIPVRVSPRKASPIRPLESEGLSPLKSARKAAVTLVDIVLKESQYKCNNKAQPSSEEERVPVFGTEKKMKATPATETVRRLEKDAAVKKVKSSSKRAKKADGVEALHGTSAETLENEKSVQVGKRKKAHVSYDLSVGTSVRDVGGKVGFVPKKPGSCKSSDLVKTGPERASRSKSRRDAKLGTPTGINTSTSHDWSSLGAMKSASMDSGLQGNGTNVTDSNSDSNVSIQAEARPPNSTGSQRSVSDERSGKSSSSLNTRLHKHNCKVVLWKWKKPDVMDVEGTPKPEASLGFSEEQPKVPGAQAEHKEPSSTTDQGRTKRARKSNVRQAKHKLGTSGVVLLGPSAEKLLPSSRSETELKLDVMEGQRVSMSLTLQVGTETDRQKGNLMLSPVQISSSSQWREVGPIKNCRVTRRMGKMGAKPKEMAYTPFVLRPTLVRLKDQRFDESSGKSEKKVIKVDRHRRKCVSSARRKDGQEEKEQSPDQTGEAAPVVPSSGSGSNRLLRSFSCPDIPSLLHSDPLVPSHGHIPPSPPKKSCPVAPPTPHAHQPHSPSKRARRHTVCSVEIEREIAPLCLRKEVHPTATSHMCLHSHSGSLTALASCFLSSPLAFLSKKSSQGHRHDEFGLTSASPRSFTKSPSPSFLKSPTSPVLTANPAFSAGVPPTPEQSTASVSAPCSVFEPVPMEADVVKPESENDKESSLSLEFTSRLVSEEKALSDSEIKADGKQVERRKVSSIRIRKTLPKPQYNLTPMGLPKAIRIKKKVFSLEEIYTNKNFSKPPEGRLETIFEVPLSRRDGSQCLTGPKRVKRFIEFPEVGVARKPKKPLVGGAGVGGAQRKAAGGSGTGRTRRGVWTSSRDEDALSLQDFDSLLCSKLNELDSWMALEQMVY